MKKILSMAISLAMLFSAASVLALPLSAEGVSDTVSEAVTTVPEEYPAISETTTVPEDTTIPEETSGTEPDATEPGVQDEAETPTEQPDEGQSGASTDDGSLENAESAELIGIADFSIGEINNDELFEQYLTKLLYGDTETMPLASSWGRAQLSGNALRLYDELKPHIIAIADGRETSTTIYLSYGTVANFEILGKALNAMYTDCSYELYWLDPYTIGYICGQRGGQYYVTFDIADGYHTSKANSYGMNTELDTSKITRAKNARDNAIRICNEATGSDYDKIKYFTDEICRLADYDYDSAGNEQRTDIGAWRIINTFDGDSNTNVVCQGFAMSFQYLCELAEIECYSVTGDMDGGYHMWNLVRMNGKIRVLDVTACEGGHEFDKFIYGAKPNSSGYNVSGISYVYEQAMFELYPPRILFPAAPDGEIIKSGYCGAEAGGKNLTWKLNDLGTLTISGQGEMVDFDDVWSGGAEWHSSRFLRETIKNVIIDEGVTSVGKNAFNYCEGIENVKLPSTLTSIGEYAFAYTGLKTITIPKGVTSVASYAFGWSSASIKEIHCEAAIKPQGWDFNWNGTSATVYWAGVPLADSGYCGGEGDGANLVWTLDNNGLLTISGQGKMKDYESSWSVPWRTHNLKISSVKISDNVSSIASYAFADLKKLETITIPKRVESVGMYIFGWSSDLALKEIHCEAKIKPLGWDEQWNGTAATVYWDGVPMLGNGYIGSEGDGTNLIWTLSTDGALTITGQGSMKEVYGYWNMPWYDYRESIRKIVLYNGLTSIGENMFGGCTNLTSVIIPKSVTAIGQCAFDGCSGLTSITIPDTVVSVGWSVFDDCTGLTDIYCEANAKPDGWNDNWVGNSTAKVNWNTDVPDYAPGDINDDYKINNQDAIHLLKHVMNSAQYTINQSGDMNGDGKVNNQDAIYLLKHILNPSAYPLKNG